MSQNAPVVCDNRRVSRFSKPDIAYHILKRFYRNRGNKNAVYFSVDLCCTGYMEYRFSRIGVNRRIVHIFIFLMLHNSGKKIRICYRRFSTRIFISVSVFVYVHHGRKKCPARTYMVPQPLYNQGVISRSNNIGIGIKTHLPHVFIHFVGNGKRIRIGNLHTMGNVFCRNGLLNSI